ncbi:MAG: hypothetical protein WB992_24480 [Bryobacteraceae bacterium]
MRCLFYCFPAALALVACLPVFGQSVISARSGVIHFSEGAVFVNDQPLDQKYGTFPNIKEGSTLRTEQGRAEVLLTPGVFLRIDENSSIRMAANALNDTRVEFLRGAVIVDSVDAPAQIPVTTIYKDDQVRFLKPGIYRLDSEPAPLVQAYSGEAEVTQDGKASKLDTSHLYFFAAGMETQKFDDGTDDAFYAWAKDRGEAIASQNQVAAQTLKDPGDVDNGPGVPLDPNFGIGTPNYGSGMPSYTPLGGIYSVGGAFYNPYAPLGMGLFGAYPVLYPVYLVPYRLTPVHSKWPRPGTSTWTWIPRPPTASHYPPLRSSTFVPRALPPRIGATSPGLYRPRSVATPRPAGVAVGIHPVGHR